MQKQKIIEICDKFKLPHSFSNDGKWFHLKLGTLTISKEDLDELYAIYDAFGKELIGDDDYMNMEMDVAYYKVKVDNPLHYNPLEDDKCCKPPTRTCPPRISRKPWYKRLYYWLKYRIGRFLGIYKPFKKINFPIIRRVYPQLISQEIVSVQPMALPSGSIFWLDFNYNTKIKPLEIDKDACICFRDEKDLKKSKIDG